MTKKSNSRLLRDEKKKKADEFLNKNACWDDLNNVYQDMLGMLSQHVHLVVLGENIEIVEMIEDKQTLITNIKILANDLQTLNKELNDIHSKHVGKTGGTNDPDEFFGTITIFEQYNLFMERHQAVIMPVVMHLIDLFGAAEKALIAKKQLKDPNVISDAVIVSECEVVSATPIDMSTIEKSVKVVHESVTKPDFEKLQESFSKLHPEVVKANGEKNE